MKKQGKKWMLVVLALLAVVTVTLPLVGCKNDTVAEQTGDGTGSGDGNQGTGGETEAGGGTEVTVDNVSTVIEGLTGEEPHTLVVTGELKDLSAIKTALQVNSTAKVNLDLSKATDLTTIGIDAFSGCSGLTSISIPSSVTSIGEVAFIGCSSLYIRVNGNNTKYSSVDGMLLNKEKTTLIAYPSAKGAVANVPTSVTTIGDDAFMGCDSLTSIDLSKATGLTTIGNDAFYNCNSLTSISIPSSVTSIGNYAFYKCSSLEEVTMEATTPPELGISAFNETADNLQIRVPEGYETKYEAEENWTTYSNKITE